MKTFVQRITQFLPFAALVLVSAALAGSQRTAEAQTAARIAAELNSNQRVVLANSQRPLARAEFSTGRVAGNTVLHGMSLRFKPSASQQKEIDALIAAQQDRSSALYHQWLTPDQYAQRFGMADADLAKVQTWLEQQGFAVDSVSPSKTMIRFSGTAAQVEQAFATEMHTYSIPTATGVEKHYAPSTALSIPAGLAGVVGSVGNVDDFRPRSHLVSQHTKRPTASFTSSQTGSLFFAPGDVATVYDVQGVYNAGYTGTGQGITLIGQSAIVTSDIEAFQSAAGLPIKDPVQVLVPNTGTSKAFSGDETESDIDIEWSGAMAKGATINFVYTGNNTNYGAFDALIYAVDNQIGTVISSSYGLCELELGGADLETTLAQAAMQGQTVVSASGDSGSTDCFVDNTKTSPTLAQQESLAVDYPASSPYVTGVGGTEISQSSAAFETPGDGYWASATTSDVISSAIKYIPEQVWNEDAPNCGYTNCLLSGGGGASTLYTKPSWQTGVAGIPSGNTRFVPDISLNASTANPGYLLCSSDTSFWSSGQVASCNSGFRDASTGALTVGGGTSFAAPIFAGMVALINQQQGYTAGQGLVNPTLYTLAADSTTYASAFHDITTGDNDCRAGSGYCSGTIGFAAGTGYDEASGLGSLDVYNLAAAWPASSTSLIGTTTGVLASNSAPAINASVTFNVTVASVTGTTIPTGTVSISVDGGTAITGNTLTANGTFAYITSFATAGTHQVLVTYSGDATHAGSTGSVSVTVPVTSSGSGTFTLAAANLTVSQGSVGSSTITVTPAGGYTGTVTFSATTTSSALNGTVCPVFSNALVSNASAATVNFTIDTNAANCQATGQVRKAAGKTGARAIRAQGLGGATGPLAAGAALAGLLLAGLLGWRSRRLGILAGVMLLAVFGFAFTGCGSSNNGTTVSNAPKGTYTYTLTGVDSTTSTITSSTTFTLTID